MHQDMKWGEHLQNNNESVLRYLNSRVGALKIICKVASFKIRKMIADGIIMSKITYCIALWGGSADQLLDPLQKVQNKAARAVTKLNWDTSITILLKQCGWLSIRQLVVYHSSILVHKVMMKKSPSYLYSMFSSKYQIDTRQARSEQIKPTRISTLELSYESFRWRAARMYNDLPIALRQVTSVPKFKKELKKWIIENIPIYG